MIQWVPIWFLVVTMNYGSTDANTYEVTFSTKQKCESEKQKLEAAKAKEVAFFRTKSEMKCIQGETPVYVPK